MLAHCNQAICCVHGLRSDTLAYSFASSRVKQIWNTSDGLLDSFAKHLCWTSSMTCARALNITPSLCDDNMLASPVLDTSSHRILRFRAGRADSELVAGWCAGHELGFPGYSMCGIVPKDLQLCFLMPLLLHPVHLVCRPENLKWFWWHCKPGSASHCVGTSAGRVQLAACSISLTLLPPSVDIAGCD